MDKVYIAIAVSLASHYKLRPEVNMLLSVLTQEVTPKTKLQETNRELSGKETSSGSLNKDLQWSDNGIWGR